MQTKKHPVGDALVLSAGKLTKLFLLLVFYFIVNRSSVSSQDEQGNIDNLEFKSKVKSWNPINCPCKLCKTYIGGVGYVWMMEQYTPSDRPYWIESECWAI